MEDFVRNYSFGFIIEKVNLTRATIKEARLFKERLDQDFRLGHTIIIIDLSNCEFLDSTFLGVLIVTLKRLQSVGGSLKLIKPGLFANSILSFTGAINKFEVYEDLQSALGSIKQHEEVGT